MAWNEKDSRTVRSQSGKGIPAQSAASFRKNILQRDEKPYSFSRYIGTQQPGGDKNIYNRQYRRMEEKYGEDKTPG